MYQISKVDENLNDSSSIQSWLLQIKEQKEWKKWEWEDDPKTIYEASRRKNITISKSKFKGAINISLVKKIVKVMKRLLILQIKDWGRKKNAQSKYN